MKQSVDLTTHGAIELLAHQLLPWVTGIELLQINKTRFRIQDDDP